MNTNPTQGTYNSNTNFFSYPSNDDANISSTEVTEKSVKITPKKQLWTQEEDKKLISLVKENMEWKMIAFSFPNKNLEECRDHWLYNLEPKTLNKTITWKSEEIDQLKVLVSPFLNNGENIEWDKISDRIKSKTAAQCSRKWTVISEEKKRKLPEETTPPKKRPKTTPIENSSETAYRSETSASSSFSTQDDVRENYFQNNSTSTTTTTTNPTTATASAASTSDATSHLFSSNLNNSAENTPHPFDSSNSSNADSSTKPKHVWNPDLKNQLIQRVHEIKNLNKKVVWANIAKELQVPLEKCRNCWKKNEIRILKKEYQSAPAWPQEDERTLIHFAESTKMTWVTIADNFPGKSPTECRLYYTYRLKKNKKNLNKARPPMNATPLGSSESVYDFILQKKHPFNPNDLINSNPYSSAGFIPLAPIFQPPLYGSSEILSFKAKLDDFGQIVSNFMSLPPNIFSYFQGQTLYFWNSINQQFNNLKTLVESGNCSFNDINIIINLSSEIQIKSRTHNMVINHYRYYYINVNFTEGPSWFQQRHSAFFSLYQNLLTGALSPDNFQMQVNNIHTELQYHNLKTTLTNRCSLLNNYSNCFKSGYQQILNLFLNNYPLFINTNEISNLIPGMQNDINLLTQMGVLLQNSFNTLPFSQVEGIVLSCLKKEIAWEEFINRFNLAVKEYSISKPLKELKIQFLQVISEDPNQELTVTLLDEKYKKAMLKFHPDKGGDVQITQQLNELRDKIKDLLSKIPKQEDEFRF